MKNSPTTLRKPHACLRLLSAAFLFVFLLGSAAQAQVSIPGTKVKFSFPSKWKFLKSEKMDANTQMYLYYYTDKVVAAQGDTTLPFLRILVCKNHTGSIYDFVFDRYNKEHYQSLSDYTTGLGLPKSGGMGYIGAYTNVKDKKDYQFSMVYFQSQTAVVEFRLETTRATYLIMEKEFEAILKSLKF